jgi:hypothetical protein
MYIIEYIYKYMNIHTYIHTYIHIIYIYILRRARRSSVARGLIRPSATSAVGLKLLVYDALSY